MNRGDTKHAKCGKQNGADLLAQPNVIGKQHWHKMASYKSIWREPFEGNKTTANLQGMKRDEVRSLGYLILLAAYFVGD